ncbi:hypothetical protein PDJAM_G00249030 [Pangasius djambal]|uniref:Uncharacterized protein n=1 Tax=Pangasius djambal TaxID=1691987 RepID=A0ACC5YJF9_9TELE|nr:hypothetical protein [Pangasius djambal]
MDPNKIKAVVDWLTPDSRKALQRFLGFANFYRRFICNLSSAAHAAFSNLKSRFVSAPILTAPDPSCQFEVECQRFGDGGWRGSIPALLRVRQDASVRLFFLIVCPSPNRIMTLIIIITSQVTHLSFLIPSSLQDLDSSGGLKREAGDLFCDMCCGFQVVFHKMSPNETLFLESTNKIYKDDISSSSFVHFQIWDFPGQVDFFDPTFDYEMIFRGTGALIFVIDAQDDYMEALGRLHLTVSRAYRVNPDINFEVFVHKVDGLSDDHKIETQRDIHQRANDDLTDAGLDKLHLSKIYVATDSSPVDMQSYELCCDMIDVVIDVSCIYGLNEDGSGTAYDKDSLAIIKLNNTTVLYLKEVTKFLALVCILREESFEKKGLIDYNFHCLRKAIHEVFEVTVVRRSCLDDQLDSPGCSSSAVKAPVLNGTPRGRM